MDGSGQAVLQVEMTIERLQQIVKLKVANVPDWQIVKGFGIAEDVLLQLYETKEYKREFSDYFAKQIEELGFINDGWDGLEALSLKRLAANIQYNQDPEFTLKVAHIANKAHRRPIVGNRPIDAQQGGTAVIYISNNFVNKMQTLQVSARDHAIDGGKKKQTDFVDPNQVETILLEGRDMKKDIEMDIMDLFAETPMKSLMK